MTYRIRTGRPDDWDQILCLIQAAQSGTDTPLPNRRPHSYPGDVAAKHVLLCEDERGNLLAALNQTPLSLRFGQATLKTAGLGEIALAEGRADDELVADLLHTSERLQREQGTYLGLHWCGRQRYRPFGFEHAGTLWKARFRRDDLVDVRELPIHRMTRKDVPALTRIASEAQISVPRSAAWQGLLLLRKDFAVDGHGRPAECYLAYRRDAPGDRCELAGSGPLLPGVLKAHMRRRDLEEASILHLPGSTGHECLAHKAHAIEGSHVAYARIYDAGRFLDAIKEEIGRNLQRHGISGPVRLRDRASDTVYEIALEEQSWTVSQAEGDVEPHLTLTPDEWVRVFFRPPGGALLRDPADPRLLSALELPLLIPPWDVV
jgi:hypothetical protein